MKKDKHFKTTSFPLAIFLYAKQQQFTAIEPTEDFGRKEFVFLKTDKLDLLVDLYKFGDRSDPDLLIEAHLYG